MGEHNDLGLHEKAIVVMGPKVSADHVWAGVGVSHSGKYGAQYPGAHAFQYGWHARKGKQPPTQALEEWVVRRGLASDGTPARRMAYLIARNIKNSGFSFGEFHWLSDAADIAAPAVIAIVRTAVNGG
jgi:hypothetical protein